MVLINNFLNLFFKSRRNHSTFVNGSDLVERRKLTFDSGVGLSIFELGRKTVSRATDTGK